MEERENDVNAPAARIARDHFLREDNRYGCAEATYITLKEVYGLDRSHDSGAAVALNGGIAYSGNVCGAVTGAAMALGELAERRMSEHRSAKRAARKIVADVMDRFSQRFGSPLCRELIGRDISVPAEHDAFIREGQWRTQCMAQIEFVVTELAPLADEQEWRARLDRLEREERGT
jgi:C_GCAxxG_C_C family probable redox protein